MKVYIVCWASGWQDDHCNTQTNSGVYGAYDSLEKAKAGLEEYKEIFVEELKDITLIIISHKKSAFSICNRKIKIKDKRIIEE